jgi:hypothetical protein
MKKSVKENKKLTDNSLKPQRFKVIFDIDTTTGEYETTFQNVSNPGQSMDYHYLNEMMKKVLASVTQQVQKPAVNTNKHNHKRSVN